MYVKIVMFLRKRNWRAPKKHLIEIARKELLHLVNLFS